MVSASAKEAWVERVLWLMAWRGKCESNMGCLGFEFTAGGDTMPCGTPSVKSGNGGGQSCDAQI